jgi:beta-carotene hydroxylase
MIHRRADLRQLGHLAVTVAAFALCYEVSVLFVPLAVLCAVRAVATAHNHVHTPIFRAHWLNVCTELLLQQVTGFPGFGWKYHHLMSHHQFPWTERDYSSPYRFDSASHPASPVTLRYYRLTYLPVFWCESVLCVLQRAKRAELIQFIAAVAVFAGGHLALIAAYNPWTWLITTFAAYAWCGRALGMSNYFQHWACIVPDDPSAPFDAWTFTDVRYNRFSFNQGYHMLHHVHPSLHWSDLPEAHARDASYTRPELIESGRFPGLRSQADQVKWLEEKASLVRGSTAAQAT